MLPCTSVAALGPPSLSSGHRRWSFDFHNGLSALPDLCEVLPLCTSTSLLLLLALAFCSVPSAPFGPEGWLCTAPNSAESTQVEACFVLTIAFHSALWGLHPSLDSAPGPCPQPRFCFSLPRRYSETSAELPVANLNTPRLRPLANTDFCPDVWT